MPQCVNGRAAVASARHQQPAISDADRRIELMSSSEAPAARPGSREIARAAVQAELSLAAYELVVEKGYGNVTLDDMAAAGGVSRSTFLRYFRTKDQAIQVALKAYVQRMADA